MRLDLIVPPLPKNTIGCYPKINYFIGLKIMLYGSRTKHNIRFKYPTSLAIQNTYAYDFIRVTNGSNLVRTSKAKNTDKENIANLGLLHAQQKVTSTIRTVR